MDSRGIVNSFNNVGIAEPNLTSAEPKIEAEYLFVVGIGMVNWKTEI